MELTQTSKNKKIAKNTFMLYVRMLFSMFVTLYTSRVILNILGVEDYGIYNVVGGIVTIFTFISSAMSSAAQRFLTFELGKKDYKQLRIVFNALLNLHIVIALVIFVLSEVIGLWFIYNYLNIPSERLSIAVWVFHFSLLAILMRVIYVPFNANIISHEKMEFYAYVGVLEAILNLTLVIILPFFKYDKLFIYPLLLLILNILVLLTFIFYNYKNHIETHYQKVRNFNIYKTLLSYTGWNLFGNIAAVVKGQGVNILLNLFFGPVVNAARGIAFQVETAIKAFVSNFQIAMNPQIIKSYAEGDKKYMNNLVFTGAKFSYFLLLLLSLPLLFKTEYILKLWLGIVPEYSKVFTFLVILNALIESISGPLMTTVQATGKIKAYQVIVGSLLMLNLPASYLILKFGFSPQSTIIISIVISIIALITRLMIVKKLLNFNIIFFIKEVLFKIIYVTSLSIILPLFILYQNFSNTILNLVIIVLISAFSVGISIFITGLNKIEKEFIINKISSILRSLKRLIRK